MSVALPGGASISFVPTANARSTLGTLTFAHLKKMNVKATFYRKNQSIPISRQVWLLLVLAFGVIWIPIPWLNWVIAICLTLFVIYRMMKLNRFIHHLEINGDMIRIETYASPLWMKAQVLEAPMRVIQVLDGELYTDDKGIVLLDLTTRKDYFIPGKFQMKSEEVESIDDLVQIIQAANAPKEG